MGFSSYRVGDAATKRVKKSIRSWCPKAAHAVNISADLFFCLRSTYVVTLSAPQLTCAAEVLVERCGVSLPFVGLARSVLLRLICLLISARVGNSSATLRQCFGNTSAALRQRSGSASAALWQRFGNASATLWQASLRL